MALNLITPPALEPVALDELKEFIRVDAGDTSQDNLITTLGMTARGMCETHVRRRFVQQSWRLYSDFFPGYIDMKLAGSKWSLPFVSGANAVLVGIRYAVALPYPPAWNIIDFLFQNANGLTTSMITGPATIAAVTNIPNQPIDITTSAPHGLQTGAAVVLAGNATLLAWLGQAAWSVTVTGPADLLLNGTAGDGTALPGGGTVMGYNYVQDLQSNPARIAPVFGQVWPVSRITLNAVQVDFQCGYAMPLPVSLPNVDAPTEISSANYTFQPTDVGRPISIPTASASGGTLNTIISSVSSPPGNNAIVRDPLAAGVANVNALLVNNPNANPAHWEMAKTAIKLLVEGIYEKRIPDDKSSMPRYIKDVLSPMRDLRMG